MKAPLLLLLASFALAAEQPPLFLSTWGTPGSAPGQFNLPTGIEVDATTGLVYVADADNHRIQVFDTSGNYKFSWGSAYFQKPVAVAVWSPNFVPPDGFIVVCDRDANTIWKFDLELNFLARWGSYGSGPGQFNSPTGVDVDPYGNVWVVDTLNNRIQLFDSSGAFLGKFGSYGSGPGQFATPLDIYANNTRQYILVADRENNRVQKFDIRGNFLAEWGSYGSGPGQFNLPEGVTADGQDNVYVFDSGNCRIQKFDENGVFLTAYGSCGIGAGEFNTTTDGSLDNSGNMYAVDWRNNRIQKFGPCALDILSATYSGGVLAVRSKIALAQPGFTWSGRVTTSGDPQLLWDVSIGPVRPPAVIAQFFRIALPPGPATVSSRAVSPDSSVAGHCIAGNQVVQNLDAP